jgi:hypothetical protein
MAVMTAFSLGPNGTRPVRLASLYQTASFQAEELV